MHLAYYSPLPPSPHTHISQVQNKALRGACPTPFDEGVLWKSHDTLELKEQLRTHFHNITRIMDCVGCDKCKMWGKLQILGMGCVMRWPEDVG